MTCLSSDSVLTLLQAWKAKMGGMVRWERKERPVPKVPRASRDDQVLQDQQE